ncbi:MAG: DNA gyrase inhibitor YacG [Hyphomicrobiales bacterium]
MAPKPSKCPICGAPTEKTVAPFCSDRCKDIDLNRWLGGGYGIPANDQSPPEHAENDNERDD